MSIRRLLIRLGVGLFFLALAGATYQGVATAVERHQFARPGGMVDVGGHQLHILCMGKGSPTVIFEAPAAGISAAWGWVQPRVAAVTRTCSYDRAGLGWSERGDGEYLPDATAAELDALLRRANEAPPYVVAGQGLGAALAVLFAARFPEKTAALVLVNRPSLEDADAEGADINDLTPWLARVGILRATRTVSDHAVGLPPQSQGAMRAFLDRPDHLTRAADELSRWNDVVGLADQATISERIPVEPVVAPPPGRVAFLTSESSAAPVVTAILNAVAHARQP